MALHFEECAHLLPEGLSYHRGFLTPDEQSRLLKDIDSRSWTPALARRTQQYGFRFDWFDRSLSKASDVEDLPPNHGTL